MAASSLRCRAVACCSPGEALTAASRNEFKSSAAIGMPPVASGLGSGDDPAALTLGGLDAALPASPTDRIGSDPGQLGSLVRGHDAILPETAVDGDSGHVDTTGRPGEPEHAEHEEIPVNLTVGPIPDPETAHSRI